jgi:RNA polymerase sigma-70 factor, ECF subfamily
MRPEIERAVELVQSKDPESLDRALALLQNTVYSFSMKVCGQREDAEDTMQEVLVKSLPHLPNFDSPRALVVWLYKVAKNRCLMSRRKSKFAPKQSLSLEELLPDRRELKTMAGKDAGTPETSLLDREGAKRLREAVQKLPAGYRLVLVLHDMEGLSDADVAEITGLRPGTVRVRLHRARLFVRKQLTKPARRSRPSPAISAPETPSLGSTQRCKRLFAELSDYLDDELDDSLCAELEKHLDGCQPCKLFLTSLEKMVQTCRLAPNESPDAHLAVRRRHELLTEYRALLARLANQKKTTPEPNLSLAKPAR